MHAKMPTLDKPSWGIAFKGNDRPKSSIRGVNLPSARNETSCTPGSFPSPITPVTSSVSGSITTTRAANLSAM